MAFKLPRELLATCTNQQHYTTTTIFSLSAFFLKEAKKCKSCNVDFCHRQRHLPFDLVLEHKVRCYFPVNGDWKNKVPSKKEGSRFYHANLQKCLKPRVPYISSQYIHIPEETLPKLHESHKELLRREFQMDIS